MEPSRAEEARKTQDDVEENEREGAEQHRAHLGASEEGSRRQRPIKQFLRLMVVCEDGYLYIYNVDTTYGGECIPVNECILGIHRTFAGGSLRPKGPTLVIASPGSIGNSSSTEPKSKNQRKSESATNESPLSPRAGTSSGACDSTSQ
ncbi:unnamed protein product, partial [Cyprideis torosa]